MFIYINESDHFNFLTPFQYVVEGCLSDPRNVLSGIPQGTILGSLFFLIYINDICNGLSPGTNIRLFADDSLLYRKIRTLEDAKTLQKDLDLLQSWEIYNKMEFHPGKCQVLTVTNKKHPIKYTYSIHNVNLETFKSVKYLGVIIDSNLNWEEQCNNIYKKASYILSFLERNFNKCPKNVKENCINALVRPILDYGCTAWDPFRILQIDKLELLNKRAARFVTGNNIREHGNTEKNMKLLGWPPLADRRSKIKLSMLYKIILCLFTSFYTSDCRK